MKKFFLVASLFTICFCSLSAQTDSAYVRTLKKMLEISGAEFAYQYVLMELSMQYREVNSKVSQEDWEKLEQEYMNEIIYELAEMMVPVYKEYYTIADLKNLISFYESPVGQKYLQFDNEIFEKSMEVGNEWGLEIDTKFRKKLKEKGYSID